MDLCRVDSIEKIIELENIMLEQPQVEVPVKHHMFGGMYAREITIPKGTVITGEVYFFKHFDIMISGEITISKDTGEVIRLSGYNVFNAEGGKKRVGYAHEDTVWLTVHPFEGEDGDSLQKVLSVPTMEEYLERKAELDRISYNSAIAELGYDEDSVQKEVNIDNVGEFKENPYNIFLSKSLIDGKGMFTSTFIKKDSLICNASEGSLRTPAGRYINHSFDPNCEIIHNTNNEVKALRDIRVGEELTIDYKNKRRA